MRSGIRIGVDVGTVRVGVARSDPTGALAVPVKTLRRGKTDLAELVALVVEYEAIEVLVGIPVSLSGEYRKAADAAKDYAMKVALMVDPVPVRLIDERLTTVQAQRGLTQAGVSTRQGRSVVDQAAAVIILQPALDVERASGEPAGTTVGTS